MHGKGTYYYPDGGKYIGTWVDSQRADEGVRVWANGDCYETSHSG